MDTEKMACCARSAGWFVVGIVIATAWGIGNLLNGMAFLEAFAVPGLIVFAIIGVVALAELDVRWFRKLSVNAQPDDRKHRHEHLKRFAGNH
jgi:hypothetical protein